MCEGEGSRGQGAREFGEVALLVVDPVPDLLGGQAGEEQVGAQLGVRGAGLAEQVAAVLAPEGVRAGAQPSSGGGGLRQQHEVELPLEEGQVAGDERGEPRGRFGPGAQRWGPGKYPLLELALALVEQCDREAAFVDEPAVQGALADTCGRGDVIQALDAPPGGNSPLCRPPACLTTVRIAGWSSVGVIA